MHDLKTLLENIIPKDWYKGIPGVVEGQVYLIPPSCSVLNLNNVFLEVIVDDSGKPRYCQNSFCVPSHWLENSKLEDQFRLLYEENLDELIDFVKTGKEKTGAAI